MARSMCRSAPGPLSALTLLTMSAPGAGVPFLTVLQALDAVLTTAGVSFAVIGGVAAARADRFRTTGDIDILTRHDEWAALHADPP